MKKNIIISLVILMLSTVVSAQTVVVGDVTVKTNEMASINIVLKGAIAYTAMGFSLELPENFMVATEMNNGIMNYMVSTNSVFIDDHTMISKMKSNSNTMRVVVYSEKNKPFKSNDDTILTITLKTGGKRGTYQAKLKSLELANGFNNLATLPDVSFSIVVDGMMGDVNGDGSIDIADVVTQVNYILDNNNGTSFNHDAADLDGDGVITISDVVSLVNCILNGGVGI